MSGFTDRWMTYRPDLICLSGRSTSIIIYQTNHLLPDQSSITRLIISYRTGSKRITDVNFGQGIWSENNFRANFAMLCYAKRLRLSFLVEVHTNFVNVINWCLSMKDFWVNKAFGFFDLCSILRKWTKYVKINSSAQSEKTITWFQPPASFWQCKIWSFHIWKETIDWNSSELINSFWWFTTSQQISFRKFITI